METDLLLRFHYIMVARWDILYIYVITAYKLLRLREFNNVRIGKQMRGTA